MSEIMHMTTFRLDEGLSDEEFVEMFFVCFPRGGVSRVKRPDNSRQPYLELNLYVPQGKERDLDEFLKWYKGTRNIEEKQWAEQVH